jgi:PAS domain S-box-containing protein
VVVYTCKPDGDFGATFISRGINAQLGWEPRDLLEDSGFWASHIHPDDKERVLAGLPTLFEEGRFSHEYRFQHKNGSYHWMSDVLRLDRDETGKPLRIVGYWTDITAQKQVEQAERESKARLNDAQDLAHFGYWNLDVVNNVLVWSDEIYQIFEIDPARFGASYEAFLDAIHPDDREMVNKNYTDSLVDRSPYEIDHRLLMPDGRIKWVYERCRSDFDVDGKPLRSTGTVQDITERKQTEGALRESEKRYRELIEGSILPVQITSIDRSYFYVNQALLEIVDYNNWEEVGEFRGKTIAPHDRQRIIGLTDARDKGENIPALMEYDLVRKDGSFVPVQVYCRQIVWEGKEAYQRTFIDLTDRKLAEKALLESEEKLRKAFENTGIGMSIRNTRDLTVICNDAVCKILGYSQDELETLHLYDITHPDDRDENQRLLEKVTTGEIDGFEFTKRYIRKDGEAIWVTNDVSSIRDDRGNLLFTINLHFDLTEKRKAEEQLRQAQKMEAVGQLTGGVAHDFNNYLGVVIGNLDLLREFGVLAPAEKKLLDAALSGALRSAELTQSLLAFSRRQPLDPQRVDANQNLDAITSLLQRTLGGNIVLNTNPAPDIWPMMVDGAQLDSCIVNLCTNARDAMPGGGTLAISTRNVQIDELTGKTNPGAAPGDYVLIEVSDNGAGMTPETMVQMFEPFFTTKDVGQGSGLGLSMVYGFVRQSGGDLDIASEVGHGTTVRLYLPRAGEAEADEAVAALASSRDSRPTGTETILVVEDNEAVRQTVVAQLVSLGYRTIEAENGAAALAILDQRDNHLDLLFSDIVMPGNPDGYALAKIAPERRPGIKTLLTSGFSSDRLDSSGKDGVTASILGKPYLINDLAQAIRTALVSETPKPVDLE